MQVVQNNISRTSALRRKICFRISFDVKKETSGVPALFGLGRVVRHTQKERRGGDIKQRGQQQGKIDRRLKKRRTDKRQKKLTA